MKKWMATALAVALAAPLYGAIVPSLVFPIVSAQTEYYTRPNVGAAVLEVTRAGTTGLGLDPNGKHVIPLGMNMVVNTTSQRSWLLLCDPGRRLDAKEFEKNILAYTTNGRLEWTAEAIRQKIEELQLEPGKAMALLVLGEYLDAREKRTTYKFLIWDVGSGSKWENEKRPTSLTTQFDNWCGWRPGQPWREPPARFWQDRLTWNRATEVSDITPAGQDAGTENWTAKWANQLGPGNSVLAKVRFEDGAGKGVDPRGGFGLFFLTKAEKAVPFSLPGSLCELVRLPKDWHALPEGLRAAIADMGLQPWLLTWNGDRRAATFVIPLAIRQAVAESFPLQPGLRRLVIVGADGFEALNGLQMSFSTDHAGQDVRVLVPTGQGNGNLPRLWLDIRGFPVSEMNEEVEASPIAPAVRETEAPAQPAPQPDEVPQRLE